MLGATDIERGREEVFNLQYFLAVLQEIVLFQHTFNALKQNYFTE